MKNQKMQQDKVAQLKMFNYQQELIKNQMLPKTNVYFQVTREKELRIEIVSLLIL